MSLKQVYQDTGFADAATTACVPMNDPTLLVEVPDSVSHLKDDMSCQVLAEVCQLDNLMEKLPAFADCGPN